ncbi:MAG TPA: ADP-glyceromanno-heptose 6-epimerase [Candidatus Nanoarchaeia archaeon]|nr:ADP-glyceromanno-heptose 6-epimerase [Candidatus Nanoarchaeia archaeon]
MKILVTGGAGFIGSNLALKLESLGHEVIVVDDFRSSKKDNLAGFTGKVVYGDVAHMDFSTLGSFDVIFHEAAITDTLVEDEDAMMDVNVNGFRKILFYAEKCGAKLIYASSAGVYGNNPAPNKETDEMNPLNAYAKSKAEIDKIAKNYEGSIPLLVGLRYFNVYGPRESYKKHSASMVYQLAQQMKSGKRPRIFKFGEQKRDFIYVKDIVEANLKAMEARKNCIVNIGTGKPESFNTMIKVLNEVLGKNLEPDYFDNPYGFYQNLTCADMSKAREKIGFTAKFSFAAGIKDYFRENGIA